MKTISALLAVSLIAFAGCGSDSTASSGGDAMKKDDAAINNEDAALNKDDVAMAAVRGTAIVIRNSDFGRMLFNSKRQAIYIFERDSRNASKCYGDCAALWPPVFTKGKPRAGKGVRASLLGTTKRKDGRLQATYAGKPLYYYAHEGRGEVRCHNVQLNGGYWWVVGPDGKRRP